MLASSDLWKPSIIYVCPVLVYRVCLTSLFHVTGPRHRNNRGDSESGLPDAKAPDALWPPISEFVLGKVSRIHSGGRFQDGLTVLALEQVVVAAMLGHCSLSPNPS